MAYVLSQLLQHNCLKETTYLSQYRLDVHTAYLVSIGQALLNLEARL